MSASVRFVPPPHGLRGTVRVPGDKSISHRAVLLGAVSEGPVEVHGFLRSADTLATVDAVRHLGVSVDEKSDNELVVRGVGWDGLQEPGDVIDVRNAGTLIRLLPGLLASRPFLTVLTGDGSIRRRPMRRVIEPLLAMGVDIRGRRDDTLPPIALRGGRLKAIRHEMKVASAQVKSCILLAGLQADGITEVVEPASSRDHTERMLEAAGVRIERGATAEGWHRVEVEPVQGPLRLSAIDVPGDVSSAAFLLVAALLVPGSQVRVEGAGLNPTRTALLEVLEEMGAGLQVLTHSSDSGEPIGSIGVKAGPLHAVDIAGATVPRLIDEIPAWSVAAAAATGVSRLRDAHELRVKESDRLSAVAAMLRALDVRVREYEDGLDIEGRPDLWEEAVVDSLGDHRLAMAGAVAGLAAAKGVTVLDFESANVSFPGFAALLAQLAGDEVTR